MPRANRSILPGRSYHVTHRCHDQAFLLKFARDRQTYRTWFREGLHRHDVHVLSYCITCNHVHMLVRAEETDELSQFMQYIEGGVAQAYNQRKGRSGAFWSDRYHATMVEDGTHLWRCLRYIDLNMVRAGVVGHPREWAWTGWHELMGEQRRNRLIDFEALLNAVGAARAADFRPQYECAIADALGAGALAREPMWTEAVAVGSAAFVSEVERRLRADYRRKRLETVAAEDGTMVLRESPAPYGSKNTPEKRPIGPIPGGYQR
jgi:putative transposase